MRNLFQWFGGKGQMAAWVCDHIPRQPLYTEAFAGSAACLFHREPAPCEAINDLHEQIVNCFRVLQQPQLVRQLQRRLDYTLYSRAEFRLGLQTLQDPAARPVDVAWAWLVCQSQSFGGVAKCEGAWARNYSPACRRTKMFRSRVAGLSQHVTRLQHVQIEQSDALAFLSRYDRSTAAHYVDPPYVHATRQGTKDYRHEFTDGQHQALIALLLTLEGSVTLSGYANPLYDQPLRQRGWRRVDREFPLRAAKQVAKNNQLRTESLWLNPHCQQLLADANRRGEVTSGKCQVTRK